MNFKVTICFFLITFLCSVVNAKYNLMNVLEKYEKKPTSIMPANIKFSYSNCGPSTDPLFVQSLSVSPDPIKLPGTITVTGAFEFTKNITGPITAAVKLIKVVGFLKIEVPCVDNVGSCTYQDVCELLPNNNDSCPPFFKEEGIPCSCPFLAGDYSAKRVQIDIDLPTKIPPGGYIIIGNIHNKAVGHIGCVNVNLSVDL